MKKIQIKKELESDIQKTCCQYLELKRHFFWRQNTIPMYNIEQNRFRAMPKYALKGVPDIIVIRDGYFIGLEIKRKGNKQSLDQKLFEKNCKDAGGEYYVITNVDQLKEIGL